MARAATLRATLGAAFAPWQARWAQSNAREQGLVRLAAALVLLALVWLLAINPALRTLRAAQSQGPLLRAQLQDMLLLQAQAQALQAQPGAQALDAKSLVEASLPGLSESARMVIAGDRATVTFQSGSADALAQWLGQVRLNAHALPLELHLGQSKGLWKGSVVLQLPARAAP
jgi:general secretion pathway protein M